MSTSKDGDLTIVYFYIADLKSKTSGVVYKTWMLEAASDQPALCMGDLPKMPKTTY